MTHPSLPLSGRDGAVEAGDAPFRRSAPSLTAGFAGRSVQRIDGHDRIGPTSTPIAGLLNGSLSRLSRTDLSAAAPRPLRCCTWRNTRDLPLWRHQRPQPPGDELQERVLAPQQADRPLQAPHQAPLPRMLQGLIAGSSRVLCRLIPNPERLPAWLLLTRLIGAAPVFAGFNTCRDVTRLPVRLSGKRVQR